MKGQKILFSKASDEWETPDALFQRLNAKYQFVIDAAASAKNTKVGLYWSFEDDALTKIWSDVNGWIWCNPPYSKCAEFVQTAAQSNSNTVMLLPARTDTRWFHDWVYNRAEIQFLRGRLKFSGSKNSAPFPSMVVVFNGL